MRPHQPYAFEGFNFLLILPPALYNLASLGMGIALLWWLKYKDTQNQVVGVETVSQCFKLTKEHLANSLFLSA